MQTHLPATLLATDAGHEADRILRACVHCGFCTATCPTFLQTGNELDSPRGRIYLIKEFLETGKASQITRHHLDRCLGCQSCETTCPSSVQYHRLLSIGQQLLGKQVKLPFSTRCKQGFMLAVLGTPRLFAVLVRLGSAFAAWLPRRLARQLPGRAKFKPSGFMGETPARRVVLLNGCVQSALSPDTNHAAAIVLRELGIRASTISTESCCGAMHYHSGQQAPGVTRARKLTDQLLAEIDAGAEGIISTASGCGNFIKDYVHVLAGEAGYAEKVIRLMPYVKDIGEYLATQDLARLKSPGNGILAWHSPCTLQHGQQLAGTTEALLKNLGFTLPAVKDSHLCCGSAGTYSLFQPEMSQNLLAKKIMTLEHTGGQRIATANIGCQCHLAAVTDKPVKHWIEYVVEAMGKQA
jgi:glycolate oxidase iron-sulfur subunit